MTWDPRHHVTAAEMNAQVRDNLGVLKTNVCDLGWPKVGLKNFAVSAGQALTLLLTWEEMTSYLVDIPAGYLSQPGDSLLVEGTFTLAANANTKYIGLTLDGAAPPPTVWSSNVNYATHVMLMRVVVRRRTNVLAAITGVFTSDSAPPGAIAKWMLVNVAADADFDNASTLRLWFYSNTAGDLKVYDYGVWGVRGLSGSTV
jgi:hypothetical protein